MLIRDDTEILIELLFGNLVLAFQVLSDGEVDFRDSGQRFVLDTKSSEFRELLEAPAKKHTKTNRVIWIQNCTKYSLQV